MAPRSASRRPHSCAKFLRYLLWQVGSRALVPRGAFSKLASFVRKRKASASEAGLPLDSAQTPSKMERAEVGRAAPATLTQSLQRVPTGYKVLETVYRSSSKVVYRAQREADGLSVVLKCLDKPSIATRKRMEREVSFLRRLHGTGALSSRLWMFNHLGVCTEVVDFLQDEGVIILADHGGTKGCNADDSHLFRRGGQYFA